MQINITIEAGSGAELRQALLELTGGGNVFYGTDPAKPGEGKTVLTTIDNGEVTKIEVVEDGATAAEPVKKRRTRAEIEAEKAENTPKQDAPPANDVQPQVGASEAPAETTETPVATEGVDLKEVQTMAANWIRKGPVYKEKVMAFLNKYKTDPAAALRIQDLTPEQLAEFFEGIKTITE